MALMISNLIVKATDLFGFYQKFEFILVFFVICFDLQKIVHIVIRLLQMKKKNRHFKIYMNNFIKLV